MLSQLFTTIEVLTGRLISLDGLNYVTVPPTCLHLQVSLSILLVGSFMYSHR